MNYTTPKRSGNGISSGSPNIYLKTDRGITDTGYADRVSFEALPLSREIPEFTAHRRQQTVDTIARRATCIAKLRADEIDIEIRECQRLLMLDPTMPLKLMLIRLRSLQRTNANRIKENLQAMRSAVSAMGGAA